MTLTAPAAYTHLFGGIDYCVVDNDNTILFEPMIVSGGAITRTDRSLQVHVDPSLTAGAMVTLTAMGQGQLTDKIWIRYSEHTVETSCQNVDGTATLVAPRPNLDVKFDVTCSMSNGLHVAGEFTSTL